jgi:transposase
MRVVSLTAAERKELEAVYRSSGYIVERQRSQCLLLSDSGKSINELASIFGVTRLTITNWLNKWERAGRQGIQLQAGRGRKKKLAGLAFTEIEAYVEQHNRNLKAVVALIKEKHAVGVSKKTLQRFLKT